MCSFMGSMLSAINRDSLLTVAKNVQTPDSIKFQCYVKLSNYYLASSSDSSYTYANYAFRYAKKLFSREKQGRIFSLLGSYYFNKGNYSKSIQNYYQALQLAEMIHNTELRIVSLINISNIYSVTEKPNEAIKYLLESLEIAENINSSEYLPLAYNNLSDNYNKLKQHNKALKYSEMATVLFEKNKDPYVYAAYDNMGTALLSLNNLPKALFYFKKSLALAEANNYVYAKIDVNLNIAKLYLMRNKIDSAMFFAKKAEVICEKNDILDGQLKSSNELYTLYKMAGNPTKALEYHEKYLTLLEKHHSNTQTADVEKNIFMFNTNKRIKEDSLKQTVVNLQKDNKIKIHQAQIKQDKLLKSGLIVLIVFSICFGVFAYNRFKISSNQHKLIQAKNIQTEEQKAVIAQKNHEVQDSLNYAKRIQDGLLASRKNLEDNLKKHFVFFKSKDIVSGDFYWSTEYQRNFYLAVCDSTGHGVPGAFMALLNIALLSEAIKEKQIIEPHLIFNEVRNRLVEIISADGHKDGFDGILIRLSKMDEDHTLLQYAAANSEPVLVRNNQFVKLGGDRMPVGKSDDIDSFTLHTIDIQTGDTLYIYTDGYADQFGGEALKKFKRKNLNELLLKNVHLPMEDQLDILKNNFNTWKGEEEQVDDVCVLGIKF